MFSVRTLAAGILLGTAAQAQEARPAVRLLPAQPMEAPAAVARAQEIGYDPLNAPRGPNPMFPGLKPNDPQEPGRWTKFTKWMEEKGKAVKKAVSSPPEQPAPRVGQPNAFQFPQAEQTTPREGQRKLFAFQQPPPQQQPPQPRVSTAEPAYRWYGWGTTTPGLNQFAPAGDYPAGSAQWYRETGATPGAFPVPTMNPMRPAPGPEQPKYIPLPTTPTVPPPVIPPPSIPKPVITSKRTIAETPAFNPKPATANVPTTPVPPLPAETRKVAPRAEPSWKPAPVEAPLTGQPTWRPAEPPAIRGQAPEMESSPLTRVVEEAGRGLIANLRIIETGPGQLRIAFDANTKALADLAVASIAKLDALKPYSVDFSANVR